NRSRVGGVPEGAAEPAEPPGKSAPVAGAAYLDRLARELIGALVEVDAGVPGHVVELHVGERPERLPHRGDELGVLLGLPPFREHADRVLAVGVDAHGSGMAGEPRGRAQDRRELGDVVRAAAEVLAELVALL